ncbi:MAG: hypothetical protein Q3983_05075 [Capnocytophaga sp.]|nr:hypothetical protein [Capnocytophaga sp.]
MKRYKDHRIAIWEEGTWVVCPKCQRYAVISPSDLYQNKNSVLRCSHCGLEQQKNTSHFFTAIIKLNCPECGTPIYHEQPNLKKKIETMPIKCPKCALSLRVKPQYTETYLRNWNTKISGLQCDSLFGLPYFFQTNIRGNLFWARNPLHIQLMQDYIASTLREREGMSIVARLPTFIKVKKNRELLLKTLHKWKMLIVS